MMKVDSNPMLLCARANAKAMWVNGSAMPDSVNAQPPACHARSRQSGRGRSRICSGLQRMDNRSTQESAELVLMDIGKRATQRRSPCLLTESSADRGASWTLLSPNTPVMIAIAVGARRRSMTSSALTMQDSMSSLGHIAIGETATVEWPVGFVDI